MRKLIAILALLVLTFALVACGADANANEDLVITRGTEAAEIAEETNGADEVAAAKVYSFTAEGVELIPGAAFDPAVLPEAASVYTVPSCAIEGTDNVYNYEAFEVTAYNDGTGEVIYSIYIIDPNITTPEGLALGDSLDRVVELYGDGYVVSGTAYDYSSEGTMLSIIIQSDAVASIEYRMITE